MFSTSYMLEQLTVATGACGHVIVCERTIFKGLDELVGRSKVANAHKTTTALCM